MKHTSSNPFKAMAVSLALVLVGIGGVSAPILASEGIFYYCIASSADKRTTYISELVQGNLSVIGSTVGFQEAVKEQHGVDIQGVKCTAYGNKSKPSKREDAHRLWKMEVNRKQMSSTLEILKWEPEQ